MLTQTFDHINSIKTKTLFQLLIITDGAAHDLEPVLSYANNVKITHLNHLIQVSALRIGSQGDTRALTCFYIFHNHPTIEQQLLDVNAYRNVTELTTAFDNIFDSFACGQSTYTHVIKSPAGSVMKRLPFDLVPTSALEVNNGDFFICSKLSNFTVGSTSLIMIESSLTEAATLPYVKLIEQKIRNIKILGSDSLLRDIVPFLKAVNESILNADANIDLSQLSRIAVIKRAAIKSQGTIINRVLQLINLDGVHKLNSQQQAQFLRQIDDTTASGRP